MEEKAQVNLEYLLLIIGAIVVVSIVGLAIKNTMSSATQTANQTASQNQNP
jgi:uncharacterized protein (UPF0333 family)